MQYYKLGQCWQHKPEPVGPRSMMLLFSSLISVCVESSTSPPLLSWGACWLACCCMDAPRAFPWGLIPAICSSSATMCKAIRLALWQITITIQLFSFYIWNAVHFNRLFIVALCVRQCIVTVSMYRLKIFLPYSVPVLSYQVIRAGLKIVEYRCEYRSLGYLYLTVWSVKD